MQPPRLDGYAVGDLIGYGPTGQVWRACADGSDQPVVIKRLRPGSRRALSRLTRNAEVANRIGAVHVVRTFAVVEAEGTVMVIAEFIAGDSLETLLARRERLDPAEVITVLAPVAQTLARLQEADLVHGALTPSNILISPEGRPLLSDVGTAVALGADATDDVCALAGIGLAACSDGRPHPLVEVLKDVRDGTTAAELATAILDSGPAAPIRHSTRVVAEPSPLLPGGKDRRPGPPRRAGAPPAARLPGDRPADSPSAGASGSRRRAAGLAAAVVTGIGAVAAVLMHGPRTPPPTASPPLRPPVSTADPLPTDVRRTGAARADADWLRIVKRLERSRTTAFDQADPKLLAKVYVLGAAGRGADSHRLARLMASGLHVTGFTATAVTVQPLQTSPRSAALRVTDRLSPYLLESKDGTVVRRGQAGPTK